METTNGVETSVCLHTPVYLDWSRGQMTGEPVKESFKTLQELTKVFRDSSALNSLGPSREIYRVRWWSPATPGSEGGLFWGVTTLQAGKVGDEYFMTHGHFHVNRTRPEFYGTVSGNGMLIQMDGDRRTWGEIMAPGSLHYVHGENAHRIANTGSVPLVVWACWPTDAGHDYDSIVNHGFSSRLVERDGKPVFVAAE
jgi:glucose-6-phosphate isomerase, archaeal